jgi:hypothetical protein
LLEFHRGWRENGKQTQFLALLGSKNANQRDGKERTYVIIANEVNPVQKQAKDNGKIRV